MQNVGQPPKVRLQMVTGIAALGALVAGCGSSDAGGDVRKAPASPSRPAAAPAVTEAQAKAIFDRYQKVNNQANAQVSDQLLSSNETGPMLEADLAGNQRIRAKADKKINAFYYRDPQFYIPRTTGPAWFAVTASETKGGNTELLVFVDTGGGAYKSAVGVWLAKGKKFPEIARGADGSATAVTDGPALGIGTQVSEYLTTTARGGRPAAKLAPGLLTSELGRDFAKSIRKINDGRRWAGGATWKARPEPVYALRTADGGTLVLSVSTLTQTYTALRDNVWYQPDEVYFGLGPKRYYKRFSGQRLWQFATHVPPNGPADVVARATQAISATGS
ncbi:hypothetical protein GWI34_03890 [Actinomadura sp. DSM 109109]|nr:hypothetical protein [Actinomadura lepetitiana]